MYIFEILNHRQSEQFVKFIFIVSTIYFMRMIISLAIIATVSLFLRNSSMCVSIRILSLFSCLEL